MLSSEVRGSATVVPLYEDDEGQWRATDGLGRVDLIAKVLRLAHTSICERVQGSVQYGRDANGHNRQQQKRPFGKLIPDRPREQAHEGLGAASVVTPLHREPTPQPQVETAEAGGQKQEGLTVHLTRDLIERVKSVA